MSDFKPGDKVIAYGKYEGVIVRGPLAHNGYDVSVLMLKPGRKRRSRVTVTPHVTSLERAE